MQIPEKFVFGKQEDSPDFLLWQVYSQWQRGKTKALAKHDITSSQLTILASVYWLRENGKDVTQVALSNNANIDSMTTSTVLRTLQQKGLLTRMEHPTDTRAKKVELTVKGRKATVQALTTVSEYSREYFAALGPSKNAFNNLLLTLLNQNKTI
jgi:MarR family transcriptional regulator, organic hydroperoxide resistance regulator